MYVTMLVRVESYNFDLHWATQAFTSNHVWVTLRKIYFLLFNTVKACALKSFFYDILKSKLNESFYNINKKVTLKLRIYYNFLVKRAFDDIY